MLWQRDNNIKLFLSACSKRDVKAAFDSDDVDKGAKAGEVIKTIARAAKRMAKDGTVADFNDREKVKAFIAVIRTLFK